MGEKQGMSYESALRVAAQTFAGAARLILKGGKPKDLLTQIAVPQGTTQVGLEVMSRLGVDEHFQAALEASRNRSAELANSFQKSL
jgi:pyrroline-5-carboxylate reductase